MQKFFILILTLFFVLVSCGPKEEMSLEEIEALKSGGASKLLSRTLKRPKPSPGDTPYKTGISGGVWQGSITSDPKTFNPLIARDGDSWDIIGNLFDSLADYDPLTREFVPQLANFEIKVNEKSETLDVYYTLKEGLVWSWPDSEETIPVTSDDVIFWYDEIAGDKILQQPGYPGQFVTMEDGSQERITVHKVDSRTFYFHFPRIIADPIYMTTMTFGPKEIFEEAKKKSVDDLFNLWSIDTDPREIPSIGPYHIKEYSPGVRVVLQKNPHYFLKDREGTTLPYIEKQIIRIVPNKNTEYLLFTKGEKDSYGVRSEDMEELLSPEDPGYTVFNGGATMGSGFMTFNQNPDNLDEKYISWFTQTEFRQAMSCLLNRDRIVRQVYRGQAVPALNFFSRANPLFDESVKQQYLYDPSRAVKLLKSIGIEQNSEGIMVDTQGNPIEFDLAMGVENNVSIDIANIFSDECSKVGIKINIKPIDFQKLVDMIMNSYDWQACMVSLGSNSRPGSGSNVWQSSGNFHIWHPLQETAATEWEARVDELYNEGLYTLDKKEAKEIWDEFQQIILDQVPVIYMVHSTSYWAVRDKWENVYYDTLSALRIDYEKMFFYDGELNP